VRQRPPIPKKPEGEEGDGDDEELAQKFNEYHRLRRYIADLVSEHYADMIQRGAPHSLAHQSSLDFQMHLLMTHIPPPPDTGELGYLDSGDDL
jgi:hypothetical protein